jgi:hypothetical protein
VLSAFVAVRTLWLTQAARAVGVDAPLSALCRVAGLDREPGQRPDMLTMRRCRRTRWRAAAAGSDGRRRGRWPPPALPDSAVLERAVLVANELVTNAVVHARTDLWLRLELRGDWLHIAVRDGSSRLLRMVSANPEAEGGRGLRQVEQLARAWGVHPHPDGRRRWHRS